MVAAVRGVTSAASRAATLKRDAPPADCDPPPGRDFTKPADRLHRLFRPPTQADSMQGAPITSTKGTRQPQGPRRHKTFGRRTTSNSTIARLAPKVAPMSSHGSPQHGAGRSEHAGHGFWLMVACCLPMILVLALIALRVI